MNRILLACALAATGFLAACSVPDTSAGESKSPALSIDGLTEPGAPAQVSIDARRFLRAVARPGRLLLIPYEPTQAEIELGTVPARFIRPPLASSKSTQPVDEKDFGATQPATLIRFSYSSIARTDEHGSAEVTARLAAAARWLGSGSHLVASTAAQLSSSAKAGKARLEQAAPSFWCAALPAPAQALSRSPASLPSAIEVGTQQTELRWTTDPAPAVVSRVRPGLPATNVPTDPFGLSTLEVLSKSPLTRWQSRLARSQPVCSRLPAPDDRFSDPSLEALAQQIEVLIDGEPASSLALNEDAAFFGGLLRRVSSIDPSLADELTRQLCGLTSMPAQPVTARSAAQVMVPVWTGTIGERLALAADAAWAPKPDAILSLVRAFTGSASLSGAWVVDDAGTPIGLESETSDAPETDAPTQLISQQRSSGDQGPAAVNGSVVSIAVINTGSASSAASVQIDRSIPELTTLPAGAGVVIRVPVTPVESSVAASPVKLRSSNVPVRTDERDRPVPAMLAQLRAGPWAGARAVVPLAVAARPPGVEIGPLKPDWSMGELVAGAQSVDGSAPGRIEQRWSTQARLMREPGGRWGVFIECRRAAGSSLDGELVTIFLGPAAKLAATIEVRPQSSLSARAEISQLRVADDRWTAMVALPDAGWSSLGESLRIGVTRLDSRGVRSTWPRAQLPWQTIPPRAFIDVSQWDRSR